MNGTAGPWSRPARMNKFIIAGFSVTSIQEQLNHISRLLGKALTYDRIPAQYELKRLRRALKENENSPDLDQRCHRLERKLMDSAAVRSARLQHRPHLAFDENLPIVSLKAEIIDAIKAHPVLIVAERNRFRENHPIAQALHGRRPGN